jgi:hypothetical protein
MAQAGQRSSAPGQLELSTQPIVTFDAALENYSIPLRLHSVSLSNFDLGEAARWR